MGEVAGGAEDDHHARLRDALQAGPDAQRVVRHLRHVRLVLAVVQDRRGALDACDAPAGRRRPVAAGSRSFGTAAAVARSAPRLRRLAVAASRRLGGHQALTLLHGVAAELLAQRGQHLGA